MSIKSLEEMQTMSKEQLLTHLMNVNKLLINKVHGLEENMMNTEQYQRRRQLEVSNVPVTIPQKELKT